MENKNNTSANDKNQHTDDFYLKFKEELEKTHSFPTDYVFKFIVPAEEDIIAKLYMIFENSNANIFTRDSKNGKYTSVTIKVAVNDSDDVVIYYRQAAAIDKIVML